MRLVDADALIKLGLQDGAYEYVSVQEIAQAPTIDPVKHGKWRYDTDPDDGDLRCSRCGVAWSRCEQRHIAEQGIWTLQTLFIYCPRCGARMDERNEVNG